MEPTPNSEPMDRRLVNEGPGPDGTGDNAQWPILLRRLTLALLAAGVLWRTLRYLLCFPIWGDEALLCLNFLELDLGELTHQLRYCQVAPILFLWGEWIALRVIGPPEMALRLVPFLAGLGALLLFWRLARLTLSPLAGTLAVGFLAVAIWPVSMGTFAKPYSLDLFMALLLLLPATHWLHQPLQLRWLVLLAVVAPVAVFGSYPVVFVGGAIGLALLPTAWRQEGWKTRLLFAAYSFLLLASFLVNQLVVGRGQLQTPVNGTTTELGMQQYWEDGFPPTSPRAFAKWFLLTHTGQMMAYPVGAQDGGSSLTTFLCLIGAWRLWKSHRRALLVLCVTPFALAFLAAALHRYPYGAACRLSQYVAPAICLTAGLGAASLIERLRSTTLRRRWLIGLGTVFLLVGLGGMVRDLLKPYRDRGTQWTRQVMREFDGQARSGAPIVVLNSPEDLDILFRWYLELCGRDRISWHGSMDWDRAAAKGEVICVRYRLRRVDSPEAIGQVPGKQPAEVPAEFEARLKQDGRHWVLKQAVTDTGLQDGGDLVPQLDQFRWVLEEADHQERTEASAR